MLVLSTVVVLAITVYLYLAAKIFYEDKTLLIYELNQTNVKTLGGEVEVRLRSILDQLRIWGLHGDPGIEAAPDLVDIGTLTRAPTGEMTARRLKFWPKSLEIYAKDETYLDRVHQAHPVPFDEVLKTGTWVRNVTLPPGQPGEQVPPLMTVATAVTVNGIPTVVYADVRLDRILDAFASAGIAQTYLVDSDGYLLASSDSGMVLHPTNLLSDPLVRSARASKVRLEVHKFTDGGTTYLGSFYRIGMAHLIVGSKVQFQEAFTAARTLIRKSLLYALMVVTAAFLIALFFSYSLTVPIQRMVEATKQIAQGNFNLLVPVSTRDELALLAASFNSMTGDLRASRSQLEEYSRDLEKKVAERTARLEAQNVAIREAQEALVRTTRLASVGEIAGRAAHEVLNPLTNITTRLEKIRNMNLKEEKEDQALMAEILRAWSDAITQGGPENLWKTLSAPSSTQAGKNLLQEDVANLSAIARDLAARAERRETDIDFLLKESARISKIVNGMRQLTRVSGSRTRIPVHRVLDESLDTMADLFLKNSIQIEKGYCEGDPRIVADHDELLQVFSNLLRNSLQAIQDARRTGKPLGNPSKVWITTQMLSSGEGRRLRIRICDNGPGIPSEDWKKVFEPDFTTKSLEEGTGLGLSICRRFIRALDGEIVVEKSTPGVETSLMIELPQMTEQNDV